MSTLIVEVCEILDIGPHDNADRLEIVTVKGWKCITQKGLYRRGQLVAYAPIDSVLPIELSDKLGVTGYLNKQRIKTVKLRGQYSQGLIIPLEFLPEGVYNEGDNVKDVLGITKYEPPVKSFNFHGTSNKVPRYSDPRFIRYTNIENIKNYPNILHEGENVIITEKIHGANFRVAKLDGKIIVGSHNCQLNEDDTSLFTKASQQFDFSLLDEGDILFGEVYGLGIQKMTYDRQDYTVAFFDWYSQEILRYLDWKAFEEHCILGKFPMVPILYKGQWDTDLMGLADSKSEIASHIREGIVITPERERWDNKLGRVILKHISERYLAGKWED